MTYSKRGDIMRVYKTVYEYNLKNRFLTILLAVVILALDVPLFAQEIDPARTEQMLASILRSAPTGIGVVENRVLVQVNDYILDLSGYTREELIGQSARMLYPTQEDSDYVGREKYRQIAERGTGSVETRWIRKDGSIRHVILSSTPLDPNDLSVGVTFTVLDITDRKNAETALVTRTRWFVLGLATFIIILLALIARLAVSLRQRKAAVAALRSSKEYLSATLRSIGDGVIACDREGRVTSLNRAAEALTGWTNSEAAGHPVDEVFSIINAQTRETAVNPVTRTLMEGVNMDLANHTALLARDGAEYQIADSCAPIHDTYGAVIGAVLVFRDVTEQYHRREELESFFTVNLDLLCIADLDGNFIKTNEAWSRILGYSTEELNGMKFLEFVHPDDMQATLDALSTLGKGEDILNFANRYRCKDGSYRDIEWRSHPKGNLIYAAARDITDRKRMEEALKASEERLDLAMMVKNEGVWDWNLVSNETYFDARYYTMVGYMPNEFPQNFASWAERVHPEDLPNAEVAIKAYLTGQSDRYDIEFRFKHKDETWIWIQGRGKIVERDEDGAPLRMIGTHTDISERKRAEQELTQSKKMLELVMNNIPQFVFWKDRDSVYQGCNKNFAVAAGVDSPQGIIGKTDYDLAWKKEEADSFCECDARVMSTGVSEYHIIEPQLQSDGKQAWLDTNKVPLFDEEGNVVGILGTFEDITVRKRLENENQVLANIIKRSQDFIGVADMEKDAFFVNPAGQAMVGLDGDDAVRHTKINNYFCPEDLPFVEGTILPTLMSEGRWYGEFRFRHFKTGTAIPVLYDLFLTENPDTGQATNIATISRNITEIKQAEEERSKSLSLLDATMNSLEEGILVIDLEGNVSKYNQAFLDLWQIPPEISSSSDEKLLQHVVSQLADPEGFLSKVKQLYESPEESSFDEVEFADGRVFERYSQPQWQDGSVVGRVWCFRDITARKQAEKALEKRLVALTQPLDSAEGIGFEDLFNPAEIQQLQDEFAQATGVASIITHPDGTPITTPSNFCRLCNDIIRKTEKGLVNCCKSDALLGQPNPGGATVQPCLSGGLWDAGAAISVGGRHVASWLIGQVRDSEQTEEKMRAYAREIGADEDTVVEAFNEVPAMTSERFEKIARALFTLANQLSTTAYQNVQQARFITERQQAEAALRASEERFRHLVENAPFGLSLMRPDQRFAFFNPQFTRIFGYTLDDIPDKSTWFHSAYPDPDYRKQVVDIWTEDLKRTNHPDEMTPQEFIVRCKDGQERSIHFRAVNLSDGSQIISYEDITSRKHAEEERRKLQAQLTQAQKMESVGRLAGGVAHDFNNMLGVILGHTEMAMEQMHFDRPIHADLEAIQKAAQRSADLTHQLLAFARKQTVAPKVLDLNETLSGMLTMLRRLIGEDIDLVWKPGHELWPVQMDPVQIDQILANLCVNARDAIAGVGKITIETANSTFDKDYCARHTGFTPGEYVLLAVSDNGCGMDNETLSHLFEPFFTTKEMGKGTGLGLASIYGAVKQNNGFINVYSEPDHGTRFSIYLPRHTAGAAQETVEHRAHAEACGNETILLVEDEPAILTMATIMLERLGYTVIAAPSPNEAIRLAGEYSGRIDLLMTDVVMPGMNGRDLAENLLSLYPDIRQLFMSGYTANVIAHHGVLDKGVHFIQKPFSLKDLSVKLREALEG
jgi:PAS domain S-box-containing protein